MCVFVLDKHQHPLMPCSEKRARLLLERGRARVHRRVPFVIRLVDRLIDDSELQPIAVKLDPGSKTTGIAVVRPVPETIDVVVLSLMELQHRGSQIRDALTARKAMRRRRRGNLRYRPKRFDNRTRKKGWLPPSLQHRVDTTLSWIDRLRHWAPVTRIATELVRFDLREMLNTCTKEPIYQPGTLAGYSLREYLLLKWDHKCAYCGKTNVPLQIEHIHCKAEGGSNRASNLTLACEPCNKAKGTLSIEVFLVDRPEVLARIRAGVKRPCRDAAVMNATRWILLKGLKRTGLPVETASGGRTKWNRSRNGIPKTHALDAACVGELDVVVGWNRPHLTIKAMGRGSYQRTRLDRYGFPRGYLMRTKQVRGFQTGDHVQAIVTTGTKIGRYTGRVAVRATGSFNIQLKDRVMQGIHHRRFTLLQRSDGYGYGLTPPVSPPLPERRGVRVGENG
jgi:5-methylcytosine-specific restriction endonuclease McrA